MQNLSKYRKNVYIALENVVEVYQIFDKPNILIIKHGDDGQVISTFTFLIFNRSISDIVEQNNFQIYDLEVMRSHDLPYKLLKFENLELLEVIITPTEETISKDVINFIIGNDSYENPSKFVKKIMYDIFTLNKEIVQDIIYQWISLEKEDYAVVFNNFEFDDMMYFKHELNEKIEMKCLELGLSLINKTLEDLTVRENCC